MNAITNLNAEVKFDNVADLFQFCTFQDIAWDLFFKTSSHKYDISDIENAIFNAWLSYLNCYKTNRHQKIRDSQTELDVMTEFLKDTGEDFIMNLQNNLIFNPKQKIGLVQFTDVDDLRWYCTFQSSAWEKYFNESCSQYDRLSIDECVYKAWLLLQSIKNTARYKAEYDRGGMLDLHGLFLDDLGEKFIMSL